MADPSSSRRFLVACLGVVALGLLAWILWRGPTTRTNALDAAASLATSAARPPKVARASSQPWQPLRPFGGQVEEVAAGDLGTIDGEVRSLGSGRPVGGVELSFVGPTGALASRTDAAGKFVFQPPAEGFYELVLARADGYFPFSQELGVSALELHVVRGRSVRGVTLWLAPAIAVLAHVVDEDDHPVGGANVMRLHPDEHLLGADVGGADLSTSVLADRDGVAKVIAPEGTILEAVHPAHGVGRAKIDPGAILSQSITIVLRKGPPTAQANIAGKVVDGEGQPVVDALVTATTELNAATDAAHRNPGGSRRSDAAGAFTIAVAPGPYTLVAQDGALAPARASVVVRAGDNPPVTLTMSSAATVRGSVKDADGRPVASFTVVVARAEGIGRVPVGTRTFLDPRGQYEVGALPAGPHVVTVLSSDHAPSEDRSVSLATGGTATADFVLRRGARLTGVVRDAKTNLPLRGASVTLEGYRGVAASSAALEATGHTDELGRFELRGLGPGTNGFLAAAPAHHGRVIGGINVRGDEVLGPVEVLLSPVERGEAPRIELVGVGAAITTKGDALLVGKIMPGGGAAEAGLQEGDLIHSVDGEPTSALGFAQAIQRIRGPEGSTVTLLIERGGAPAMTVVVPRRRIKGRRRAGRDKNAGSARSVTLQSLDRAIRASPGHRSESREVPSAKSKR